MREFLIRRTDGEWFDLPVDKYSAVLNPNSFPSETIKGWGDHRIKVLDCEISFSVEDPGIQVSFHSVSISDEQAAQIVLEILENITALVGQKGRIIRLS